MTTERSPSSARFARRPCPAHPPYRPRPACLALPTAAACAVVLALPQCSSNDPTGRDWVNGGASRRIELRDGVLDIDKRFIPVVQNNYAGYIGIITQVFKEKQLFNLNPVALVVYFMADEADLKRYCKAPLQGRGTFVKSERAVYVHAGGNQLVDAGTSRALIRDIARAVMHDMYFEDNPAWMDVGVTQMFADGAFGPTDPKSKQDWGQFKWASGVPNVEQWRTVLGDATRPTFDAVRTASAAELAKMGEAGAAVAIAAVYLLKALDQLETVIWQIRPGQLPTRDPASVLGVIQKLVPRYGVQFRDPVAMLFKMRPDYRTYLECELAGPSAATLERAKKNAAENSHIGGYWWQYARFAMHLGGAEAAIAPLERCRECEMQRDKLAAMDVLAGIYYSAKKWPELEAIAREQLLTSALPNPKMHMLLAEAIRTAKLDEARSHLRFGLALPALGFEDSVARIRELEKELAK